ncbi:MAG: hypothetical protein AAFX93_09535 [Verrucomicrobiota bacterium]
MDKNNVEKLLKAEPFKPFCFVLPKGRKVCVSDPECADIPNKGNNLVVWEAEQEAYSIVSLPHVDRIEPQAV